MEAAAEAPARPVPTTMTSNLRLLPGFTSFMSNLCWSQLFSIGPVGAPETSRGSGGMELMVRSSVSDDAGQDHDGEADVDDADQHREAGGEVAPGVVEARVVEAEALEQAPRAVEQVDGQGEVGEDVEDRHPHPLQALGHVLVGQAPGPLLGGDGLEAPRQVGQVEDQEQQDDDA